MIRTLTFLACGALLVTACGSSASNGSSAPDDPVSAPAHNDDGSRSRAELRKPEEGLVDVHARVFERHKADGRNVTLFYWSGVDECVGLDRIEVTERRRKVVLTVFEGRHPEAEVCIEMAVRVRSRTTLERPLGDRKVVDGAR